MQGTSVAITIGTVLAAIAVIIPMYFTVRQSDRRDARQQYQDRIDKLEEQNRVLRERNEELSEENLRLMRKVLRNGTPPG